MRDAAENKSATRSTSDISGSSCSGETGEGGASSRRRGGVLERERLKEKPAEAQRAAVMTIRRGGLVTPALAAVVASAAKPATPATSTASALVVVVVVVPAGADAGVDGSRRMSGRRRGLAVQEAEGPGELRALGVLSPAREHWRLRWIRRRRLCPSRLVPAPGESGKQPGGGMAMQSSAESMADWKCSSGMVSGFSTHIHTAQTAAFLSGPRDTGATLSNMQLPPMMRSTTSGLQNCGGRFSN